MNEGHSTLLFFELMAELRTWLGESKTTFQHIDQVRRKCVFITHTLVAAGHDRYPAALAYRVLKGEVDRSMQHIH